MKKINLISLLLITCLNFALSQDTGYYYKYDLEKFILCKVGNISLDSIQTHIKYPPILRENKIEGHSKFMIKSNGNKSFEIIQLSSNYHSDKEAVIENSTLVENQVYRVIRNAFEQIGIEKLDLNTEKCFTEFTILFDIAPFEETNINYNLLIKTTKAKISVTKQYLIKD